MALKFPALVACLFCCPVSAEAGNQNCVSDLLDNASGDLSPVAFFVAIGGVSNSPGDCVSVREIATRSTETVEGEIDCSAGEGIWESLGAGMSEATRNLLLRQFSECPDLQTTIELALAPLPPEEEPARETPETSTTATDAAAPAVPAPSSLDQAPIGDWFVLAGALPHSDRGEADRRAAQLRQDGLNVEVIDTDDYSNLRDGLFAIVVRSGSKDEAQSKLQKVRSHVQDAYVKKGN